ncbi:MAG: sulfotransferase [Hyphomonadaceae bacterium]
MLVDKQAILEAFTLGPLLEEAKNQAGLSDFGDEGFIVALEKMQECIAEDARLDAQGLGVSRQTTVRHLINRLRFQDDLKRHPEILEEDVSDPMVILGLPRSGTTKTHRMMGVDPNLLKTYMWQLVNPAPIPGAGAAVPDPRIAAAYDQEPLLPANDANPALRAGHLYAAAEVQEDLWLFGLTFNYAMFTRPLSVRHYEYLLTERFPSDLDNYAYFKSLIQYLQWQQGGRKGRRWLFKNTGNIAYLDALTRTFPRASYIHIHRHPAKSIPSVIKLATEGYRTEDANVDPLYISAFMHLRSKESVDRYLESRDRLGLNDRIYDVQYEQIRQDPMPVIREFYDRAGHELTPDSEQRMLRYEAENEQGKHGEHRYSLEQFGLSEKHIEENFGEYIRRFIPN